ncbi:hypothetical protein B484DRAFT_446549 [Ochromonadaceae sp. CCMP2298]|nr:hypothetical protein B484DRAFT_446549 [Ochromonadaceae sp. CCMP2298]
MQLNLILWYYPAVWVLAAGGAIGADWTFALYMMGGIFGKVIFSSLVRTVCKPIYTIRIKPNSTVNRTFNPICTICITPPLSAATTYL